MRTIKVITTAFLCQCLALYGNGRLLLDDDSILDGGIQPFLDYQLGVWGNVSGGITRSADYNSMMQFGASADTEKLHWWSGGDFYASWLWNQGDLNQHPLTGLNGSFEIDHNLAANTIRFYSLYFRQNLIEDRVSFKIGQLLADDDFMVSEYAGLFINSAFGDFATLANLSNYPEYPLAAPGFFVSGQITESFTLRSGVYTNDAGQDVNANWGFEWNLGGDSGYAWFTEAAYTSTLLDLPSSFTAGLFWQLDAVATDLTTGNTFTGENTYNLYFMWDQSLILDAEGHTKLGGFWRASYTPDNERFLINQFYTDAGLNWYGPIPDRPNDALGLAFNFATYTSGYRSQNPTAKANQWIIEATYSADIYDGVTLQPDIQYIIHPENATRDHAFVIGVMLSVSL